MNRDNPIGVATANFDRIKNWSLIMSFGRRIWFGLLTLFAATIVVSAPVAAQQGQRPNIVFIRVTILVGPTSVPITEASWRAGLRTSINWRHKE